MSSSTSDKTKFFVKIFYKNFNLDDSGIPLSGFPCITIMKLHNIPVTLKLFQKVMIIFDFSEMSPPDSFPVTVLKKYEPGLP